MCNGYYGPNFDEPLCATCHSFLYTTQPTEEMQTTISDDEDSGNDEPPFKDKQEVDDDDDVEDVDEVPVVDDIEDDDPEADMGMVVERAEFNVVLAVAAENENAQNHVGPVAIEEEQHVLDNEHGHDLMLLLPIQRPRPTAPPNLPHYVELLSEGRANSTAGAIVVLNNGQAKNNITALPVEIMVIIFSYLDDMSMWKASEVCRQWRSILDQNTSQLMWKKYLKERWPLFQCLVDVPNWFKLYSALMSSCFCRTCLLQMALKSPPRARQNAIRMNFLRNDFRLLNSYASEGIEAIPLDKQNTYWQASILGPTGSPYEGGKFFLYIFFPDR